MTPAKSSCLAPIPNVLRPTFLYIISQAVIPAPYQVRGELQRESRFPDENRDQGYKWFPAFAGTTPGFPRIKYGAGLVKPGMTIKAKGLLTHYTNDGSSSTEQKVCR
jgi:hypothetical protein